MEPATPPPLPPTQAPVIITKFWTMKKIIFIFVGILLFGLLAGGGFILYNHHFNKKTSVVEEVLLNQPLFDLAGKIEKVDSDSISVIEQPMLQDTEPQKYQVTISDQTKILFKIPLVPYSLKLATESAVVRDGQIDQLKIGQTVVVRSVDNVRAISQKSLLAETITVSPGATTVLGIIKEINDQEVLIQAGPPSVGKEQEFRIAIDDTTEIVESEVMRAVDKKMEALPISALAVGDKLLIYTDSDIFVNQLPKALKIELVTTY